MSIPAPSRSIRRAGPSCARRRGRVNAKFLIIACNAYLGRLVPQLHGKIMPVTSYIMTTEPLGEDRARALIRDGEAVADTNFIVDYFRLTPDTRLLFGGRASYTASDPADLAASVRARDDACLSTT